MSICASSPRFRARTERCAQCASVTRWWREHTPKGLGNHAAIVTEKLSSLPVAEKIRAMLDDIGYTGFANFDLKYTGKPGEFVVFEVNLRQGRSNMYMTAAGMNIARLAAEEYDAPFTCFHALRN